MIPNLVHLTRTKKTLAPAELGHGPEPMARHKVLASLMVDLVFVALISNIVTSTFGFSLGGYFNTPSLHKIWSLMKFNFVNLAGLTAVAFSYFYLSYFLNEGQTLGARLLGQRRRMKGHDSRQAFKETVATLKVYFSFGFTASEFAKGSFRHDFHYQEFLGFREMKAPNLVRAIELAEAEEESQVREAA